MRPTGPKKIQTLVLLALLFALPALTFAQSSDESQTRRSWGYVFAGTYTTDQYEFNRKVGSLTKLSSGGFGWEWLTFKGVALGVEGAGSPDGLDSTFAVSYHFVNLPKVGRTLVPFATAGTTVSWGVGDGGLGARAGRFDVGTGASLWLHRRIGPRFEIRKYLRTTGGDTIGSSDFEYRIGITFR